MRFFHLLGAADPVPPGRTGFAVDNGRRIGITLFHTMYRMRIHGLANVPTSGPLVVVANHTNFVDGAVLFGLLPRRVSFLIKSEAVKGPLGWLLTAVGQYAIKRGTPDREPLMAALAQVKAGGGVGVFPEGTRGAGLVENVFNGAGWFAVRSNATVLPIAVRGTDRPAGSRRRFRPVVHLLIGAPFTVAEGAGKKAVDAATILIQQRLSAQVAELDDRLGRQKQHD